MKKKIIGKWSRTTCKNSIENAIEQNIYDIIGMVYFNSNEKNKKYFGIKSVCNYKQLDKFIKNLGNNIYFCLGIGTLRGNMSVRENF